MEFITPSRYRRNVISNSPTNKSPDLLPNEINTEPEVNRKIPPGFTCAPSIQTNPLPIILMILFASHYIKTDNAKSPIMDDDTDNYPLMDNGVEGNTYESDIIMDMLSSIHPYMDPKIQDGINLIFGLYDMRDRLRSLIDGTYQTSPILTNVEQPFNYKERAIGIIKSIQPYISLENQTIINRILDINSTMEKLIDKLERFRQRDDIVVQGSMSANISKLMEMLDIIKVLIPVETHKYISQINNILKIIEAVEVAQLLNPSNKGEIASKTETRVLSNSDDSAKTENKGSDHDKKEDSDEKLNNISNMLKTMLNPEQAKSLELVMGIAQLLTKDSEGNDNAD